MSMSASLVKAIAFYLPQYHPIPENDEWWGKGFTEWRNVAAARPQFPGHHQPHVPSTLGFYDLRLPEVRQAQATLAAEYGISGFCYYHYWFNGRRILERPFREVLESGQPRFPFCLCWANENWTRAWDGGERTILLGQTYSADDDIAHIKALLPAFADERYIRINGRPLFLVYRTEAMPEPRRTSERWREAVARAGLGDLFLVRVEGFKADVDPREIGFDASVDFAPRWRQLTHEGMYRSRSFRRMVRWGLLPPVYFENKVVSYRTVVARGLEVKDSPFLRFGCAAPGFDNSARRRDRALILIDSDPSAYESWLRAVVARAAKRENADERLVFINAWNEWAEGNHLEPDTRWGLQYLEATRRALRGADAIDVTERAAAPTRVSRAARVAKHLPEVARHVLFHVTQRLGDP